MIENEKNQLYQGGDVEPIDLLRDAFIRLKATSSDDWEDAKKKIIEEQEQVDEEKESLVFYSRYKDYNPTRKELERIVAKGTPKEKVFLLFQEIDRKYYLEKPLLTDEEYNSLLNCSYRRGSRNYAAYFYYYNGALALRDLINPFCITFRSYDRSLSSYDLFLSIFYEYWRQTELMNGALRMFEPKGKKIPDKLRGWLEDNEALENGKELREFFATKTFPCGVLKQNEEGLFYVDITEGKKPLYEEFKKAIAKITENMRDLKTLTEEITKFVKEWGLEEFVPFMIQDCSDVMFGIDSKSQKYITPEVDSLSYFLSEYNDSLELPSRGKEMFAAFSKLVALLPNYIRVEILESSKPMAEMAIKQRIEKFSLEEYRENFLRYGYKK